MEKPIETYEYKGCKIKAHLDECAEKPFDEPPGEVVMLKGRWPREDYSGLNCHGGKKSICDNPADALEWAIMGDGIVYGLQVSGNGERLLGSCFFDSRTSYKGLERDWKAHKKAALKAARASFRAFELPEYSHLENLFRLSRWAQHRADSLPFGDLSEGYQYLADRAADEFRDRANSYNHLSEDGLLLATLEDVRRFQGDISAKAWENTHSCIKGYIDMTSAWMEGRAYGYTVEGPDGEGIDSCWGFYGEDGEGENSYMMQEARASIDSYWKAPLAGKIPALDLLGAFQDSVTA